MSTIFFWLSILIVVLPIVIQYFVGNIFAYRKREFLFNSLSVTTILLQVFLIFFSYVLQGKSFVMKAKENGFRGEYPNVPPPVLGLLGGVILGIVLVYMIAKQSKELGMIDLNQKRLKH